MHGENLKLKWRATVIFDTFVANYTIILLIWLPFLPRLKKSCLFTTFIFVTKMIIVCVVQIVTRKRQKCCTMHTFSNLLISNMRQYECTVFWYALSKIISGHNVYFLVETHTLFIISIIVWHLHRNPILAVMPGNIPILRGFKKFFSAFR